MSLELRNAIGLLSQDDVASMIGVSKTTLRIWRREKRGPAFIKLEKAVLYRLSDVQNWLASRVVDPSNDNGGDEDDDE